MQQIAKAPNYAGLQEQCCISSPSTHQCQKPHKHQMKWFQSEMYIKLITYYFNEHNVQSKNRLWSISALDKQINTLVTHDTQGRELIFKKKQNKNLMLQVIFNMSEHVAVEETVQEVPRLQRHERSVMLFSICTAPERSVYN